MIPILSLADGYGPYPTPAIALEAARAALAADQLRPGPAEGLPRLREAVGRRYQRLTGAAVDPARVVVTPGAKFAVLAVLETLLRPGDEVLIPTPNWFGFYDLVARAQGATPRLLPLAAADDYALRPEALAAALTPQTRLLILTNPNNPTGRVYSAAEYAALLEVTARYPDLYVLSDEIYDGLVYDGGAIATLLQFPDEQGRHVVVNGFSKSLAMASWRVGYVVAPPAVALAVRDYVFRTVSGVAPLNQLAAAAALDAFEDVTSELRESLTRNRELLLAGLQRIGVPAMVPQGAYFVFADLRAWLPPDPDPLAASAALFARLRDHARLQLVDGGTCGAPGFARITFAVTIADLREGLRRLATGLRKG